MARAVKASQALELLSSAQQGLGWPCAVAGALSRTLAVSRVEAQSVLDVVLAALHGAWVTEPDPQKASLMRRDLKKFEDYKRAITRNVSPALVLETALMSLDGINVKIFD